MAPANIVVEAPAITNQPVSITVMERQSATFSVPVSSCAPLQRCGAANLAWADVFIHRPGVKKAALIIGISFIVLGVFIPVTTTLVTFVLPETFASSAKL